MNFFPTKFTPKTGQIYRRLRTPALIDTSSTEHLLVLADAFQVAIFYESVRVPMDAFNLQVHFGKI